MTSATEYRLHCTSYIPIPIALPRGFSYRSTDAPCARARSVHLSVPPHDMRAPGDVDVRERLPPGLLQSIRTDAFEPLAFVPGRFARSVHESAGVLREISCNAKDYKLTKFFKVSFEAIVDIINLLLI